METSGWSDSLRQSGSSASAMARDNNLLPSNHLHDVTNNNKEQQNRNFLLQQDVQAVVSEKGKQKIQALLDQVYGLLPIEQLLLYLKLPTEHSGSVDPLRQSINPLGSRSEISQTIIWIQTHLEEDKELSLQKKGVYDDYVAFCTPNGIKPLSTADFGKVMKQVYPNVRPRRLGTRGQSKYCYSGLRTRLKLDSPLLPDLAEKTLSTEANCSQSDYMAAAWYIIKEWAEDKLSMQFKSAISLAYYLVKELSVALDSDAAQLVTHLATSTFNDNTHYGYISRHRETTLQLQRKIQQTKESKKKQIQNERSFQKFRSKKFKGSPPSTSCSTSPIIPLENKERPETVENSPNCDNTSQSLPDFNSFHRPAPSTESPQIPSKANYPIGKTTLSRGGKHGSAKRSKNGKYKGAQRKVDFCDMEPYDSKDALKQKIKTEEDLSLIASDTTNPYFSRERLESVSRVSKDDLDEYLGTSNSQEQEEEIIKYLGNDDVENEQKLTQLRELLVQNCPTGSNSAFSSAMKGGNVRRPSTKVPLQADLHGHGVKRRVSFETNVQEDTNSRRHDINFIPISSPSGKYSMSSSANASPFVSPRNTPIMRSRMQMHQNKAAPGKVRGHKSKHPNLELKLTPDANEYYNPTVNLPMSAPPSPKTYGYGKFYPHAQGHFQNHPDETIAHDSSKLMQLHAFRSQSVPVNAEQNQIYGAFNYPPQDMHEGLGVNEMMNGMGAIPEEVHMFDACRLRSNDETGSKFPSRSVPSTPLPYNHPIEFQAFDKSHINSKSFPNTPVAAETFTYTPSHDYLLNGQPVKPDKPNLSFIQADDSNTMYSTYSDSDALDASSKNPNVNLEQNLADCELINKSNIDDLFKVVPE